MVFITCNQHKGLLLFTKQTIFTPFAMHSIVGKVNMNAVLRSTDCVVLEMEPCGNG